MCVFLRKTVLMSRFAQLHTLRTSSLIKRLRLTNFALFMVYVGAAIAILASLYTFFMSGILPASTFWMSLVALLASVPVYMERKTLRWVLAERKQGGIQR